VNVSQRLTATIDHVNAVLGQAYLLPCRVEAIALTAEGRIAEIAVRFEDGTEASAFVASAFLNHATILEAVHRIHLLAFLDVETPQGEFDIIAYGTGMAPPSRHTHRDQTHPGPEVAQ
jgi:hypothetical protein